MAFYVFYPPTNLVTATIVGPVSVTQGTAPWVVSGTVTANQGTNPWIISGTVDAVQSGTWTVNQGSAALPGDAWYMRITDGASTVGITGFSLNTEITNAGGAAAVNIQDGGNSITVDGTVAATQSGTWNIGTLTSITNPVTVNQGTSPWITSGTSTITGTVTANQGTSPWVVSGTVAATQSGTWTTGRTWTLSSSTDSVNIGNFPATVAVTQSTSPWVVSGTVAATQSGTWTVQQGTPPWSVSQSGTWNIGTVTTLTSITNPVAVTQSGTWTVQPGNTANTTPWLVTDTSDGSVAPGTAATKSSLAGGQYNSTPPTLTNTQQAALQLDVNGNLKTSATATVAGTVTVVGNVASGATDSGNPVKTGGIYNSTTSTFTNGQRADSQVDTTGALYINREVNKATYSSATTFTPAALLPTDIFTITGSSTKVIRVQKISINGTNTGNTNAFISLIRRSTANTGGTSTTLTNVPSDSTQAAGTATVRAYTVNPTLGTTVGTFRTDAIFLPTLASTNAGGDISYEFGQPNCKSVVLRGTSEVIAVNVGGVTIGGTTVLAIDITWTEE